MILDQFGMYFCFKVIEDELRERVERLETRQATDDASLLILNRYWNQVSAATENGKFYSVFKTGILMEYWYLASFRIFVHKELFYTLMHVALTSACSLMTI